MRFINGFNTTNKARLQSILVKGMHPSRIQMDQPLIKMFDREMSAWEAATKRGKVQTDTRFSGFLNF